MALVPLQACCLNHLLPGSQTAEQTLYRKCICYPKDDNKVCINILSQLMYVDVCTHVCRV